MNRIALGLMRLNNIDEENLYELLVNSLKLGVNFIDLADIYCNGDSERKLGRVLFNHPDLRKELYIQTKVGIRKDIGGYDLSYEYIIKAVKDCLNRLNIEYLDCLLLHRIDLLADAKEVAKAIKELKDNGLIKDFGVSNFNTSEIEYLKSELKDIDIKYNQVNLGIGNTTMLDSAMYTNVPLSKINYGDGNLLFYLKRENIKIQCWSPFQYGLFEGSIFDEEKYPLINEVLKEYADKYKTSKCAIATAFLLRIDPNLIVITGSTNINHIKECIDGESISLTKEDWYKIYRKTNHFLP